MKPIYLPGPKLAKVKPEVIRHYGQCNGIGLECREAGVDPLAEEIRRGARGLIQKTELRQQKSIRLSFDSNLPNTRSEEEIIQVQR